MSMDNVLTPEGHAKLSAELEELKGNARSRIADAIREAKAHGDLKENAAYHEAKLNQSRLEQRIAEIDGVLQRAKIVERGSTGNSEVFLGANVLLKDLNFGDEFSIELVGTFESTPGSNMVSIASPLGKELIGKETGAEITVQAPSGSQRYRILSFS